MELHETIAALKEKYTQLPSKDHGFALSLIQQYEKKKGLSPKQQMWAEKLLSWTVTGVVPVVPKETVSLGNFSAVYALFEKAKEHLKYPKIRLLMENGPQFVSKPLMLALAGAKSKTPGVINVTDGGKYGENIWYGRINQDGNFEPNKKIPSDDLDKVVGILAALALDPAKTVAGHGKLTGNCSFCDLPLTADNSTAVGYGPICAKNFGLFDQWKVAAKNMGLSEHELALTHIQVQKATPKVKPKLFTPVKKPNFIFGTLPASAVTAVAKAVADAVDKEVMSGLKKARVVDSVPVKKKLIVDKERDDYLF